MAEFLLSIHKGDGKTIVSVCEAGLLGKHFEEGDKVLEIVRPFYGGEKATIKEIVAALKGAHTATIVGNTVVAKLLDEGILKVSGVHEIEGVKHAHIYRL